VKLTEHWASQDFSRNLWKPTFYYRVHIGPPSIPFLSQTNPVNIAKAISRRPILILYSHTSVGLPAGTLSGLQLQNFQSNFAGNACYISCTTHHSCFHHPNNICCTVQARASHYAVFSSSHKFILVWTLYSSILLSAVFTEILSLCHSLSLREQETRPYKTVRKLESCAF
jgi:hypothetical protein